MLVRLTRQDVTATNLLTNSRLKTVQKKRVMMEMSMQVSERMGEREGVEWESKAREKLYGYCCVMSVICRYCCSWWCCQEG